MSTAASTTPEELSAGPGGPSAPSADPVGEPLRRSEGRALGSPLRLTTIGAGETAAGAAWSAVVEEFAAVDLAMSRFRDDSGVTALGRRLGESVPVGRRLRVALSVADRAHRRTGGRFDPRVLAALDRLGDRGASVAQGPIGDASGRIVTLARSGVTLTAPVDLGGIGKGLALRWGVRRAMDAIADPRAGVLLEAGGDVAAGGRSPAGGWAVGIEDPWWGVGSGRSVGHGEPLAVVDVVDGAIATSSVRLRRWVAADGRPVHHLVDPSTGEPGGHGLLAVTVALPDPAWAEVWSKALFLAGPTVIGPEARARGLAAWWVDANGRFWMTPEARLCSTWVDEGRVG